jgi:hypothetical protein
MAPVGVVFVLHGELDADRGKISIQFSSLK